MRPPVHLHLGRNGTLKMCFHVGKALFITNILPVSGSFHTKMVPHSKHITCLMWQKHGMCKPFLSALNSLETVQIILYGIYGSKCCFSQLVKTLPVLPSPIFHKHKTPEMIVRGWCQLTSAACCFRFNFISHPPNVWFKIILTHVDYKHFYFIFISRELF